MVVGLVGVGVVVVAVVGDGKVVGVLSDERRTAARAAARRRVVTGIFFWFGGDREMLLQGSFEGVLVLFL